MNYIEPLMNLGLTTQEANIYIACLKAGVSPASVIAKIAKVNRTTVYPTLKSLARSGFVSVTYKNKSRQYRAQRPSKIFGHFQQQLNLFEGVIPDLNKLVGDGGAEAAPGLRFIESLSELHNFYEQVLLDLKGGHYCSIGSTTAWLGIDPEFFTNYWKNRAKAKIKTRVLVTEDSRLVNPDDPRLLRTVKYLPSSYNFKSTIDIYSDKILIINPKPDSLAVVIEIPAMVDIFESVFEMLWGMVS